MSLSRCSAFSVSLKATCFLVDEKDVEAMKPLFNFVFYLIEKTRKLRLGKEVCSVVPVLDLVYYLNLNK